jgi:alkylhydroperoxidase family enzyme
MTETDSMRLRDAGFSDREIVDITLAAAARNYFSRAIQALAVDVQVPPGLSDRLRDALLSFP